ncbi:alpha/beta hydrolase [Maribellus mangrovi]|uniref:alpha/beta hydrolase n=1 Tax=Maribellus mangrovi TaxID=3133146 RepID=UPI0030ED0569
MKNLIYLILFSTILFACNQQTKISGPIDVPDALFTYTAEGNGIPCVIFTGSENVGHRMLPAELQEHFVFIHADPSKINSDSASVSNISLDDILDDLDKLRAAIGVEKIAILGHSMFGRVPLEYAVKYPDNISYAISTGSVPYSTEASAKASKDYWYNEASEERKNIRERNWEELRGTDLTNLSPSQQFIARYTANIPFFFCDTEFDMTPYWEGVEMNTNFLNHYSGTLMKDIDHTDLYKTIKCPVLVFSGKCDFYAPYFLWENVRDKNIIPNLKLIVYDNAGHNPFMEIPEVFAKDVLDWVQSNE